MQEVLLVVSGLFWWAKLFSLACWDLYFWDQRDKHSEKQANVCRNLRPNRLKKTFGEIKEKEWCRYYHWIFGGHLFSHSLCYHSYISVTALSKMFTLLRFFSLLSFFFLCDAFRGRSMTMVFGNLFNKQRSGSTESQKAKIEALKKDLLDNSQGTSNGVKANAETKLKISSIVSNLEKLNTNKKISSSPLMNGNWKLIYTTNDGSSG